MNKVYIAMCSQDQDVSYICAVFSKKEDAQRYCEESTELSNNKEYTVHAWLVDAHI